MSNLRNSFPGKTENELKIIYKRFYLHFCDIFVETLKTFTVSREELKTRFVAKNPELVQQFCKQGKSVIIVAGHYGNWEWMALVTGLYINYKPLGIYRPLHNPFFNRIMIASRSRFGIVLIPDKETGQYLEQHQKEVTIIGFLADQTPSNVSKCYWTNFLNQDTPVFFGTEKYALKHNYPVVFTTVNKIRRGYYEMEYKLISEKPLEEKPGDITEKHVRVLEQMIVKQPEYWLWTHRRWKKKRDA